MQFVQTISHQMATLSTTVQAVQSTSASWTPPPSTYESGGAGVAPVWMPGTLEPRLPAPERFDGSPGEYRAFLTQCKLIFSLQPLTFPTDASRVAYIISQLTGQAKRWGTTAWNAQRPCIRSAECFMAEIHRVFDRSATGPEAGRELLCLHQGRASVSDYARKYSEDLGAPGLRSGGEFSRRRYPPPDGESHYSRSPSH